MALSVHTQKALRVSIAAKPSHQPLACPSMLMRYLLIEKPAITATSQACFDPPGELRTEDFAPLPNTLVRHDHTALSEQVFNVAQAQREAMVEPHGAGDDVGWKSITTIRECLFHADIVTASLAT